MAHPGVSIFSLCVAGFPGTSRALQQLASVTGLMRPLLLTRANPDGPEVRFYCDFLARQRPPVIVLGGWSPAYEPIVEACQPLGCRIAVYWTSSPGQVDLSGELETLLRVLSDTRLTHRWFADRGLADSLRREVRGVRCLPNVFKVGRRRARRPRAADGMPHVSLFCSPHEYPRKNVSTTLCGMAAMGQRAVLHLNGLSERHPYDQLLETLKLRYVEHGWMPEDVYDATVCGLDLGLQISLAESYNYVAVEHLLRGVPVVVSRMVPSVADLPDTTGQWFVVDRPDRANAIAERVQQVLADRVTTVRMVERARQALSRRNRRHIQQARHLLGEAVRGDGGR